jgi:hypothetical protein
MLLASLLLALGVSPLAQAADTTYKIQRIFTIGDRVADVNTAPTKNGINLDALNDRGQILFATLTLENPTGAAILRYADGQFTVIAAPDRPGPLGIWPKDLVGYAPNSMNEAGNVVHTAVRLNNGGNRLDLALLLWDAQTGKDTPIVTPGMPAPGSLTFQHFLWAPVLNNRGEIAFPGWGQDQPNHYWNGVFLRGADGKLQSVALTDQTMPDGRKLADVYQPSFNDAGLVTFLGAAANDNEDSAYLWEKGTITPVAVLGMDAPEGGKIRDVRAAFLNNQNHSVLVLAARAAEGPLGLYRFAEGKLTALAVRGQTLPDGAILSDIPLVNYGVSNANELGQHAFLARLQDGTTAGYLLDPDGNLTPILKSGAVTELGKITLIGTASRPQGGPIVWGSGIGLNSQGQVAFNVRIDNGPTTLVLLTPATPAP